jgi:hypothetical protein
MRIGILANSPECFGAMEAFSVSYDDDNDVDSIDKCIFTLAGDIVNIAGCLITDLCPCTDCWKNLGGCL